MKYLPLVLLGFFLLLVLLRVNAPAGEVIELIPATNPSTCICFEYTVSGGDNPPIIYQSCESSVLDQVDLPGVEISVLEMPCDSVFKGTKLVAKSSVDTDHLTTSNQ